MQVSHAAELSERSFSASHLILDGAFLAPVRDWSAHGFSRLPNRLPPTLPDIEAPCWFIDKSAGGGKFNTVFCRGEIDHALC